MNVHVSYKVPKTPDIEKEINHQIDKTRKRLRVFRPELVHLKAVLEENPSHEANRVSLNLRLPSGQLAVEKKAPTATAAIKAAFDDLMQQVNRHKELLRSSHRWRRWRGGGDSVPGPEPGVPFEETVAAVLIPTISADDISGYVDANLGRLERFVERELYFRQAEGEFTDGVLSTSDVVNESIARALGDHDRPEKMALEPWLYRLALESIGEMTARLRELDEPVHLEESRRKQNVQASDEVNLQFHQADEGWTRESAIADRRIADPEQSAYSDEMLALVHGALRDVNRTDREAFLLYGMEGFSLNEIASITGRHSEAVRESVERARDCVRKTPTVARELQNRHFVKTRTAVSK